MHKKWLFLTGAGISAESGLKHFAIARDYGKGITLKMLPRRPAKNPHVCFRLYITGNWRLEITQ